MKNLFKFVFILNFLLTGFCFGQDLKVLKKDPIFINYLKKEIEVINKVDPQNHEKIASLISDKEISEYEKEDFAKYIGFENFENYSSFIAEQNKSLQKLNKDYNLSTASLNDLILVIDSPEIYPILEPITEPITEVNGDDCSKSCVRTGNNCLVKTTSLAVVSHLGCAAIDSFGIGLLCHAAVQAAFIAEIDECDNQKGVCLRGCKK